MWQAAKDGDEEKVRRLVARGTDIDARDSAGFCALVTCV